MKKTKTTTENAIKKEKTANYDDDSFVKELSDLCKKYKLTGCVFAGENNEGRLIGYHCIERYAVGFNQKDMISSVFNSSRIYQSAREKIMHMMDGK